MLTHLLGRIIIWCELMVLFILLNIVVLWGRLIYLAFTRPDLAYVVHVLAQFMHQPHHQHWEAALQVVRHLKRRGYCSLLSL